MDTGIGYISRGMVLRATRFMNIEQTEKSRQGDSRHTLTLTWKLLDPFKNPEERKKCCCLPLNQHCTWQGCYLYKTACIAEADFVQDFCRRGYALLFVLFCFVFGLVLFVLVLMCQSHILSPTLSFLLIISVDLFSFMSEFLLWQEKDEHFSVFEHVQSGIH